VQKLIEIPKDPHILVSSQVLNFDKPDLVYIPVSKDVKLLAKKDTEILIGTPLFKMNKQVITSPVSGTIKGLKEIETVDGNKVALVIANDYKEKRFKKPSQKNNLINIKKERLASFLKTEFNIDIKNKKELILSCFDDEPYVVTESFYLFLYFEGFLELLDKLSQLFNLNITLCAKSSNSESISKLLEHLGMYPNITLKIILLMKRLLITMVK